MSTEINNARKRGTEYQNSNGYDYSSLSSFAKPKSGTVAENFLRMFEETSVKKVSFANLKEECDAFQREAADLMVLVSG